MAAATKTTKRTPRNGKTTEKLTGINVQIPTELHRQLRMKALSKGQTLPDAVGDAVRAWVKAR